MALTIIKPDKHGRQQVIAEEDMYLDASGTKVIIVKEGETVPPEASSVLAMKGGKVHARFMEMVQQAGAATSVVETPVPQVEPEAKVVLEPTPEPVPEISAPKPKKPKETPAP